MRFGPTSIQLSSLLAKGLRRPKLRSDLRISEQTVAGETSYVIKNPETVTYNRYGAFEYELLTLFDGTRTPAEVAQRMTELHPDRPVQESDVLEFLDGMEPAMWEQTLGEKNLAVLERIRQERKTRVDQSKLLYITFKAIDPDKLLGKMDRYLGWIYTRGFVFFSLGLFVLTLVLLAGDYARVQRDTAGLYSFHNKTAFDIWVFWILLWGLGCIHELGHGLTCKHFGGEVHQMGFMLIYFTPAFYTDTTDILLFPRHSHRQWTFLAGIWIELVICGLSTIVWSLSLPGTLVSDIAYKTLLFSGIQGALVNLNPLIKADGYYMLAQHIKMDNLREDTFVYLKAWAELFILRRNVEVPPASRRVRRIYFIFGLAALAYSAFVLLVVAIFVKNIFVNEFGDWGYLLTAGTFYLMFRKKIQKRLPAVRAWFRRTRERYMAWRMTRVQQVGIAAFVFLLVVPPTTLKVSSDFVLEPGQRANVRATVPGMVGDVPVRQGANVRAGDVLAVLKNPELEAQSAVVEQQLRLAEAALRSAQTLRDPEQVAKASRQREELQSDLEVARSKLAQLTLRAPFDGEVTTPDVEQRVGDYLNEGDDFSTVVDRNQMRARILVQDLDLEDVSPGAPVKLHVRAYPFRTFAGSVQQILPAAALDRPVAAPAKVERYGQEVSNYFAVVLTFPNPDGVLREGMTGTAKISGGRYPIAWRAGRSAWHWLRSQIW